MLLSDLQCWSTVKLKAPVITTTSFNESRDSILVLHHHQNPGHEVRYAVLVLCLLGVALIDFQL